MQLICVREGASKLRVRILTPGYDREANVQFPTALRVEGKRYTAPASAIRFGPVGRKFFYRLLSRDAIREDAPTAGSLRVFEATDATECLVCMDTAKDTVFAPCGHFGTCGPCAAQLSKCPLCRTVVTHRVLRRDVS